MDQDAEQPEPEPEVADPMLWPRLTWAGVQHVWAEIESDEVVAILALAALLMVIAVGMLLTRAH